MNKTKAVSLLLLVMMVFSVLIQPASADAGTPMVSMKIDVSGNTVTGTVAADSLGAADGIVYVLALYNKDNVLVDAVYNTLSDVNGTVSAEITSGAVQAKLFAFDSFSTLTPICRAVSRKLDRTLKVLAIGNSFSDDGMQWLYQIAESAGYSDIILGNLYIGGCSLDTHYNNSVNNSASYDYRKNTTGSWVYQSEKRSMLYGIQDEKWDFITLQQASGSSGMPNTYSHLQDLIDYVNENKTNPDAKLGWHMTWAYQQTSDHWDFPNYGNSQATMYNAIISTVKEKVIPTGAFDFIIPAGTAIQNARTSYIGDTGNTLTRDGYHLSYNYGRYIAGLTWMQAITGVRAEEIEYRTPDLDGTGTTLEMAGKKAMLDIARESVNNAVKTPFAYTQSAYTEEPQVNWDNYTQLELELKPSSSWNSMLYVDLKEGDNKYITTKKFTKDELPNGTLIVVDEGWQYRPEGWQKANSTNSNLNRPGNVSTEIVEVNDVWWDNFTLRAFNLSTIPESDISSRVDEAKEHFRIYIPKN